MIVFLSILVLLMAIALVLLGNKVFQTKKTLNKPAKLSREDKKKLERARKAFENLMGYDEKQAMKRE